MKTRHLIAVFALALTLGSCGARFNNPEELTVPILQAVKSDDVCRLESLQPPLKEVNGVFHDNKGTVGYTFYNKYSESYREVHLKGRMRTCMDIIDTITAQNKLDWDKVEFSNPKKEDINDSLSAYTIVTTDLKFPSGVYEMKYHAVQASGRWYLLDDVYFGTKQEAAK